MARIKPFLWAVSAKQESLAFKPGELQYCIALLSSALIVSPALLATKDQETKSQSYLSQIKEYFYPKDAPAPELLKKFVREQAKICGVDPESINVRVRADQHYWACLKRIYPSLPTSIKPDNKPCIYINPLLGYKIMLISPIKNFGPTISGFYGENVIAARHELGHTQEYSIITEQASLGALYLALIKQCNKTLAKYTPKNMLGLVPVAGITSATMLEKCIILPLYRKYKESSADNFAISHSSEKDYLLAFARMFEKRHKVILSKLKKEAKSSPNKKALLELAERYPVLFELYYWDDSHPSDLSRAKKFRAAAEQLDNLDKTDAEKQNNYPIENEMPF